MTTVSAAGNAAPAQPFPASRALIAYFSFTGNTQTVARLLHRHTGATLMAVELPADYALGLDEDEGPEPLEPHQIDLASYDLVFIGFPIWTGQIPVNMESWIADNAAALAGKTLAPFCTHSGVGPGEAFDTLRTLCPDSTHLAPLALLGGVEEDGVLYPLEGEQLEAADRALQAWAAPLVTR